MADDKTATPSKKPSMADQWEQVRYLLSCVAHANDGKVDHGAVSEELNIVSKAASAKRFERLAKALKEHDKAIADNGASSTVSTANSTPAKPARTPRSATKRKAASVNNGDTGDTDNADMKTPTKKRRALPKKAKVPSPVPDESADAAEQGDGESNEDKAAEDEATEENDTPVTAEESSVKSEIDEQ